MGVEKESPSDKLKVTIRKLHELTVAIIILSLIVLIVLLILNQWLGWVPIQNASLIASGMGAVGTLVLAWITFQTIRQNAKLVEHQQKQLEFQQDKSRPALRQVGDFMSGDNPDEICYELQNIGKGAAFDITFRTDILIPELGINTTVDSYDDRPGSSIPPLASRLGPARKNRDVNMTSIGPDGGVLEAGSTDSFTSRINFINESKSNTDIFEQETDSDGFPLVIRFTPLIEELKKEEISSIIVQFSIMYEDIYDEDYKDSFQPRVVNIKEVNSAGDISDSALYIRSDLNETSIENIN